MTDRIKPLDLQPRFCGQNFCCGKTLQSDDTLDDAGIASEAKVEAGDERLTQTAHLMLVGSIPSKVPVMDF